MGASPGRSQAAKPELDMNCFQASSHSVGTALGEEQGVVERIHLLSLCLARYTELTVERSG